TQDIRSLNRHPGDLKYLLWRDRSGHTILNCTKEFSSTSVLPFILFPKIHLLESRPAVAFQLTEVIQLQHAPGSKNLNPLFGEACGAIGEIEDRAERPISKAKSYGCFIFGNCHGRAIAHTARLD